MNRLFSSVSCFTLSLLLLAGAYAADAPAPPDTPAAAPALDVVTLKDGSVIYGQVLGMIAGELHIKTGFGPTAGEDIIKVMWPNVSKIVVNRPVPFIL